MTILDATLEKTVLTASLEFLRSGVSVIPLKGKLCSLKSWSMAQQYRASQKVLLQWYQAGLLSGVAVVCGAVSGNLVVLDFDSHEAVEEFKAEFPSLQNTLIVASGSRRGAHYYYVSVQLPNSLLVKNHELRANGMYVVAPPSVHPDSGLRYEVSYPREPMVVTDMDAVVRWIKSKRPPQAPAPITSTPAPKPPAPAHAGGVLSREAYFRKRYIDTAVAAQLDMVSSSSEGSRNTQLYLSSVSLGGFVGAGALGRSWLESELVNAARRAGLTDQESIRTIASGLNAGEKRPRRIPGPPAPRN